MFASKMLAFRRLDIFKIFDYKAIVIFINLTSGLFKIQVFESFLIYQTTVII